MLSLRQIVTASRRLSSVQTGMQRNMSSVTWTGKFGVIGGGRMSEAMLRCLSKSQSMENVHVYDPNEGRTAILKSRYGVTIAESPQEAVDGAEFVMLAVKPQHCEAVAESLTKAPEGWIVSVMAGIPMSHLEELFKTDKIIRCMPNTPAVVMEAMSVWTSRVACPPDIKKKTKALFAMMGDELYVQDENYIDMATAISGSGPAYVFLTMEAMIDAAVHMGFPRDTATRLVVNTIRGSASLAQQSEEPLSVLRNNVTSPGGTTASALYALERGGHRTVIADAVWAAYRRARELGEKNPNVGPGRNTFHP